MDPAAPSFSLESLWRSVLSGVVEGLREDAAAIERVVNDLADGSHVGVYVHAVTRAQVADDALGRDFESRAGQLRVAARLYVVNHLQTLSQRKFSGDHFSSAPSIFPASGDNNRKASY